MQNKMIENMITVFNADKTKDNLLVLLGSLLDCKLWVPCTAVLSDSDQSRLEQFLNQNDGDIENLIGKEFTANDTAKMIPDILQNGEYYYFPAFTSEEKMGEYGEHFSKVETHIKDIIKLARINEKKPCGIVINAFSEPFVISSELYEMLENAK